MGNSLCKKQDEKHPTSTGIKNGTTKEATVKKDSDLNHEKANDLVTENLNNTANTSQGLDPTQPICHHMDPSIGDEVMLIRMYQVPAADAPQNQQQSIHKAVKISQDADPVKDISYLASAVKVTQEHTSLEKPKDNKTSATKQMLQQATPARPPAGPCGDVEVTAGELDVILEVVCEILGQQQSTPSAQVQQQDNRQVMCGHTQHNKSRDFTQSQQKPAAKETMEVPLQTVRTVAPCDMDFHNSDVVR